MRPDRDGPAGQGRVLHQELADCTRRRSALFEVLELKGRDAPNLSDLTERLQEFNSRIKRIKVEIEELEAIAEVLREIVSDASEVTQTRTPLTDQNAAEAPARPCSVAPWPCENSL